MANTKKHYPVAATAGHRYFTHTVDLEGADRYECECKHASFFKRGGASILEHIATAKAAA